MKIHTVIHVSLLEPVAKDPLLRQISPPPPPVEVDGKKEYIVQEVLDSGEYRRWKKPGYLVQ